LVCTVRHDGRSLRELPRRELDIEADELEALDGNGEESIQRQPDRVLGAR
jgi:hypothetical protein